MKLEDGFDCIGAEDGNEDMGLCAQARCVCQRRTLYLSANKDIYRMAPSALPSNYRT